MFRFRSWKFFLFLALAFASSSVLAQVAVTTYHNDNARTGQNVQETILTPSNVNAASFGKLATYNIQPSPGNHAYVYAEPLFVPNVSIGGNLHNVVYVVTEANQVFAFDADLSQSTPLWSKTYETPFTPGANDPSNYLADTIGIQSTPVIDVTSGTMYFVSNTKDSGGNYVQNLHAIDITNGADKLGGPVKIQGSVPGTGDQGSTVGFNAATQNQRPALLLSNGTVYIAWGSYDDDTTLGNYHGWVMAYDAKTLLQTGIFNTTPNGSEGSTWALGALAADTAGNIYVGAANGSGSGADTNPSKSNYANSYLKLSADLRVLDYFTPFDWSTLDSGDQDPNGGGAVALPDQTGLHTHLLVWGTKAGKISLADRDNMGMLSSGDGQLAQSFQAWTASSCKGDDSSCVRTLPAYWNNNVYFIAQNHGLQAYSLSNGQLSTTPASQDTTTQYVLRGASPSVSANGATNGIVWAVKVDPDTGSGKPATLYAHDATNVARILYSSNDNTGRDALTVAQNFTVPMIANGKVYVATRDNLTVYGLLQSSTPPFGWMEAAVNSSNGSSTVPPNGTLSISGWAADKEDGSPVARVQVFIDGSSIGNARTLGLSRPDVASAFNDPRYTNSGWTLSYNIGTLASGTHTVTAVAYDSQGVSAQLRNNANSFTVPGSNTPPFGWLDSAASASNGSSTVTQNTVLSVSGWAADKEDGSPVARVQVFIDSSSIGNATLGLSRRDVASAFNDPRYTNSGWTLSYNIGTLAAGTHTVTAVAFDSQAASAQLRNNANTFTVPGSNTPPFGWLDSAASASNGSSTVTQNTVLSVSGWAADKEDGSPVARVQVFIDGGSIGNATLGLSRPDVASASNDPRYTNSGWTLSYNIGNLAAGTHTVTAVAFDSQAASAQLRNNANTFTVATNQGAASINHVLFMLQENRTFDNYFGMLNPYRSAHGWNIGDNGQRYDVDGIDDKLTTISNPNDEGTSFSLFKLATTCTTDMSSAWIESWGDVNRFNFSPNRQTSMDGFVHTAEGFNSSDKGKRAMGYYDEGFLNYYYFMASNFALSDRWFSPIASKTIPNRLVTMTGGTTQGLVHDPSNNDHVGALPIQTIFEELDGKGVSWKIYYSNTNSPSDPFPATSFAYFKYSPTYLYSNPNHAACAGRTQASSVVGDSSNSFCIDPSHIAPLSQYFTDLKNGTLPHFAYIEPGFNDGTDEHPGGGIISGQQQVAKIVNAFMNSSSWKDSVFFLSYDEGGGPYDHVPPVPGHTNQNTDASLNITTDIGSIAVNPDSFKPCPLVTGSFHCDLNNYGSFQDPGWNSGDAAAQQGFAAQLGFRVPNIVISPFTRRHYVSHIPMDHTAVIKFVENRFIGSSAHLTARDAAQPDLLDFFDFNAVPWAIPPTPPQASPANSCNPANLQAASAWMATQQLADGAIQSAPDKITPYFANAAAVGWLQDPASYSKVGSYMQWYFNHVNRTTDVWGTTGTIYDYAVSNGATGGCINGQCSADSTDSYASTLLSLAWTGWSTGDPGLRNLISANRPTLDLIAGVLSNPKDIDSSDGLTWAYAGYPFKFLVDNCEGYRGLSDYANLVQQAFNDSTAAATLSNEAANMKNGILAFWNPATNTWAKDKASNGAFEQVDMTKWYPDAVAQIYPVVLGVVAPTDPRAVNAYASLNSAFPNWDAFGFNDSFPWAIAGYAAAVMGDATRSNQYRASVESKYVNVSPQFPRPWYDGEDGWFMRMVALQSKTGMDL